jgi:hypothetical protein
MTLRMRAVLWALLVLSTAGAVSGQERFGALTGRVTDQQGGAIPGVIVTTTHMQTGEIRSFVTDANGQYAAADLTPGRYTVRFELIGFAKAEREVIVQLGRTFEVNTQLALGELSEIVQVDAVATPLVDMRSTVVAHNVTAEEFERIPKGRSFQSVAVTAPSVNQGDIEGGLQVNGASGSENQFTVDGVATNSLLNGQSRQNTVFEYLQEVQVKTVGIPAEFGGALGGVISAVTKSGGNTFRGEAHYYYLGSGLSAGPVQRLVLSPVDERTVSYFQDPKQSDHRHEAGGSLGGPIVRGRLFFFGSLSPRWRSRTHEYRFSNGRESGAIENTQNVVNAYGKISFSKGRFNSYFGALWTPTYSHGTLPAYNGFGPQFQSSTLASNLPNATRGFEIAQRNFTGNADLHLNTSLLSVKGGYFRDEYKDTGVPTTTPVRYRTNSIGLAGVPPELQGAEFYQNTPAVQLVAHDTTTQAYIQADYSASFAAAGFHAVKIGAGVRRNGNDVNQRYPGGQVDVYWDSTFTSSVPGVGSGRGVFGYYEVNDFGTSGTVSANIAHIYAQDQWTLGNLTLNLGVRLENETIPSFRPDLQKNAIAFGFLDKIAPRAGAAYDVFGNGRTKVYGSYGRYYDWTKYELSRGSFGGDIWKVYYRALDDPAQVFKLSLANMPGRDLWGSATGFRDRRVPNFESVDPSIKPMSQDSFNVGFEHQLGMMTVASINYVHNSLVRTIEDIGLLVDGNEVYLYANPGEGIAKSALVSTATPSFPVPKATRQYDALQVSMIKGFSQNWFMGGSYVWSRLFGNYSGIQNSDEIRTPTLGLAFGADQQQAGSVFRLGGNANRSWDLDEWMWDAHGRLDPQGRLATDRPHVLKLYGATVLPFGTELGVNFYAGSGTPLTTYVNTLNGIEVMVNGRGDMGRTPVLSTTDLLLSHQINLGGRKRLRLELNVLNLFNQKTTRHRFNYLNRARASSEIDLSQTNLSSGYDYDAMIDSRTDPASPRDPRYGLDDLFSEGTQGQFTVKFLF